MKGGYVEKEDVPWVPENSQSITAEMRDHNVLGVKVVSEQSGNPAISREGSYRRNEGAQEPRMTILE